MTNLVVVEIDYMEGPPDLWYSVVDRDVKDRTHVVAGFLDKAEADEYVARKRAAIEPECRHDWACLVGGIRCVKCGEQIAARVLSESR